ncbi:kinase-like domain-containing protein [Suillus subluteus]|nr:kinase-like domain-containing protein [Suillus subluteus]
MEENVLEDNTVTIRDFASQIKLQSPVAHGSFGDVYRCVINEGKMEVAVKVFVIDPKRSQEKLENALRRELKVWLKLSKSTYIVPLLGVAKLNSPLSALVSEWMSSGTLHEYLQDQATTLTASTRVELIKGVAGGVNFLRSENVVHGDLYPGNVLIDGSGNPRLTDFGLATVVGDQELQWTTTTEAREFSSRWRAPEVIGIERDKPERPTFESDIYSLGSVMFFIISGDIPWKDKKYPYLISVELWKKATPTRSENIPNGLRPEAEEVLEYINPSAVDDSQAPISTQPVDLTGQIIGQINGYFAGGVFANVFKCECKQPMGRTKVAVKVLRFKISQEELERFLREAEIWAIFTHEHIVPLLGTARELGSYPAPALVFPWFETTLLRIIEEQGANLSIESKLDLLLGTASGLEYLHGLDIVHGDITSSNVLVDIQAGKYRACLTDVGLATILGGRLCNRIQGSNVRREAMRWTAPELLDGGRPTKESDMYSFGCVMFHVLTLDIPWHTIIDDCQVHENVLRGECISRPATSDVHDMTDARWNVIATCWSVQGSRPSASMATNFLKSELEGLSGDDMTVREVRGTDRQASLDMSNVEQTASDHAMYLIQHEEDVPSPVTSDSIYHITNARCNEVQQCLSVDGSARPSTSTVTEVSEVSTDDDKSRCREEKGHRQTSSDMFDAAQRTASGDVMHPTREEDLHESLASSNIPTSQPISQVSTPLPLNPLNVLLFGETRVDKSSIIDLIVGQNIAHAVPDSPHSMLKHIAEVTLRGRRFQLWEVSSTALMGFLRRFIAKWRIRASYRKLHRDGGAPLLLYCMRGPSAPTASRDYQDFTDIVGSTSYISIAAVVNGLEESLTNMDDWWTQHEGDLKRLNMQFSNHACITSLPDDPSTSQSRKTIRNLIESYTYTS